MNNGFKISSETRGKSIRCRGLCFPFPSFFLLLPIPKFLHCCYKCYVNASFEFWYIVFVLNSCGLQTTGRASCYRGNWSWSSKNRGGSNQNSLHFPLSFWRYCLEYETSKSLIHNRSCGTNGVRSLMKQMFYSHNTQQLLELNKDIYVWKFCYIRLRS